MRRPLRFFAAALAVALSAGAARSDAVPVAGQTMKTGGSVIAIAADGERVAVATEGTKTTCDRILLWTPASHRVAHWDARTNCPRGQSTSGGQSLLEVALAGTRVAWLEALRGNLQDLILYRAGLGSAKRTGIAFAENQGGADGVPDGNYLGNVRGDGALLVFNAWELCTAVPAGFEWNKPKCEEPAVGTKPVVLVKGEKLFRITSQEPILTGLPGYRVVSVNAGRIATRQDAGGVTIVGADGNIHSTVPVSAGEIGGAALDGSQLAVLRGGAVEVYDVVTGAPQKTLPLGIPPGGEATLTDLDSGLAVYLAAGKLHVLRLADGADRTVGAPAAVVDAELEGPGLSFAYNLSGKLRGRIAFWQMAAVRSLFA